MDSLLLEQHLRSPLRLFPDPMFAQFQLPDSEMASAALMEKARQQLQLWGRTPYAELLLPQIYPRPNFNALLWQNQWSPQFSAGFLSAAAAAASAASTKAPQIPSPHSQMPTASSSLIIPSTSPSSKTPSPDIRPQHYARFSPYPVSRSPLDSPSTSTASMSPNTRQNNNLR